MYGIFLYYYSYIVGTQLFLNSIHWINTILCEWLVYPTIVSLTYVQEKERIRLEDLREKGRAASQQCIILTSSDLFMFLFHFSLFFWKSRRELGWTDPFSFLPREKQPFASRIICYLHPLLLLICYWQSQDHQLLIALNFPYSTNTSTVYCGK